MNLPEQAIKEFQAAWRESFGENITSERAAMEGAKLLAIYSNANNQHEYELGKSDSD